MATSAVSNELMSAINDHVPVLSHSSDTPRIAISVIFPFWTAYRASLQLIRYSTPHLFSAALFPFSAVMLLVLWVMLHHHITTADWIAFVAAFCFTPVSSAFSLFLSRRRSPFTQGPFLYVFEGNGMHLTGESFNLNIGWSLIARVEESAEFMLFFISPKRAYVIPKADIMAEDALEPLRQMVQQYVRPRFYP